MAELFNDSMRQEIEQIFESYPTRRAAILPVLHRVQKEFGWISAETEEEVARVLELPPVKVHEVLTFYHMLHAEPVGRHHLQFCRTLPCALRGAAELYEHTCKKLGIEPHEITKDGRFSVEEVECLGVCGNSPAVQVNETYHLDLTIEKLDKLLDELD